MIATKISWKVGRLAAACLGLSLLAAPCIRAQAPPKPYTPWVAPADARAVKNPLKKTPDVLAAGAETFRENCEVCHGPKGDGNGLTAKTLTIKPANFTDPQADEHGNRRLALLEDEQGPGGHAHLGRPAL